MRTVAFVVLVGCGGGSASPDALARVPLVIDSVTDLGVLPLSPQEVGRDGGQSGLLGGQVLFAFGDTFLTAPNSIDQSTVLSATAGWSTPGDPLALAQAMAGAEPAQLIPYTAAEIALNKTDSLNGWALWPNALVDVGTDQGLITFQRIKRMKGGGFTSVGVSTAHLAAGAPIATRDASDLFAPPEPLFQPAFAHDGHVYAWECESIGFLNFGCKLARAPLAGATQRSAYEFYDGTAWQADIAKAAVILEHGLAPSISYNAHLQRFLAVTCEVVSSTMLLRTAEAIEGPWSEDTEIMAGATGVLAPKNASDYNYICVEHPELASADGTSIVLGYSRPTDPFRGDVRLARVALH